MRTRAIIAALAATFLIHAAPVAAGDAETLAGIRKEYADVLALTSPARQEILALARILRERPAMAIDFSHLESPQYCLNTGGDMLHIAEDPGAEVPLVYLHPAAPLVAAGLDVSKLPVEPESLKDLKPGTWYYYPAGGRTEPLHGRALGAPMLVRTAGER